MFKHVIDKIPTRIYLILVFVPIPVLSLAQCILSAARAFVSEMINLYHGISDYYTTWWNKENAPSIVQEADEDYWNHS